MNTPNNTLLNSLNQTQKLSSSKKLAFTAIMSALIAVTTVIAIPLPPPIGSVNLAPVVIFVTAILLGATVGAVATFFGCAIGFVAGATLGTINAGPFFFIFLIGLIVARTPMALAAGLLRKKSEIGGMALGVVVETVIFFAIDIFLFGIAGAIFVLATVIDFIYIPIAIGVLLAARRVINAKYLS